MSYICFIKGCVKGNGERVWNGRLRLNLTDSLTIHAGSYPINFSCISWKRAGNECAHHMWECTL